MASGVLIPEKQQTGSEDDPGSTPQQGQWVLSPSWCGLRPWEVQGYLRSRQAVVWRVDAFALCGSCPHHVSALSRCADTPYQYHSAEGYIMHLWDWQCSAVGFGNLGGVWEANSCKLMHMQNLLFCTKATKNPSPFSKVTGTWQQKLWKF